MVRVFRGLLSDASTILRLVIISSSSGPISSSMALLQTFPARSVGIPGPRTSLAYSVSFEHEQVSAPKLLPVVRLDWPRIAFSNQSRWSPRATYPKRHRIGVNG